MLRVRGLSLRYPNGKLALSGFDLTVAAGEFVVVLGGNGSGKTTLLRCITRTVKRSAGEIWLGNTDLCALEGEKLRRARLALAMIWQHPSLVRRRCVLSNVASGALGRHFTLRTAFGGLPKSELEAARIHLAEVGLAELVEQRLARCPAVKRSASRLPASWRSSRRCCWRMNRSRVSTRKRPTKSCAFCSASLTTSASPSSASCIRSNLLTPTPIA